LIDSVDALYRRGAVEIHMACASGTVEHFHTAVTLVLLAPGQETVFPLPRHSLPPKMAMPSRIAS
jgi:hypothetical protein